MLEFQNLALPCIMLTFVQVSEKGLIEIKMLCAELSLHQHIWFLESMTAKLATWLLGSMLRNILKNLYTCKKSMNTHKLQHLFNI